MFHLMRDSIRGSELISRSEFKLKGHTDDELPQERRSDMPRNSRLRHDTSGTWNFGFVGLSRGTELSSRSIRR